MTGSSAANMEAGALKSRNPVLIYRSELLPKSETFILNQAEALSGFSPWYCGLHPQKGLPLPQDRVFVINTRHLGRYPNEFSFRSDPLEPLLSQPERPVLIHAHFGPDGVEALPLAERLSVPLIVTFHGYDATVQDDELLRMGRRQSRFVFARRKLFERAAYFTADSDFLREKLLVQGMPPEKIITHYVGVDTGRFVPDPAVPREPLVVFVGRLVEKKGCAYLLRAIATLQQAIPELELAIIGEGPLEYGLKQLARQLRVRVRFIGYADGEVIRSWLNRAVIFCAPSITAANGDAEGLPTVVVEAQAMGVPVVSTRHAGTPEAVADGETGLLVPERDAGALTRAIHALITDPRRMEAMSRAGRERVTRFFDLRTQTAKLEELYCRLLAAICGKNEYGES